MATNAQVLDVLVKMGLPGAININSTGRQTKEFWERLKNEYQIPERLIQAAVGVANNQQVDWHGIQASLQTEGWKPIPLLTSTSQNLGPAEAPTPVGPPGPITQATSAPTLNPPREQLPAQVPPQNITINQVNSGNTGPPPAPKTDKEIEDWVRQKYGSYAWMLDDPNFQDVRQILKESAAKGWDEQTTASQLQNTQWWKTTENRNRKWDILKKTDPATVLAQTQTSRELVSPLASQMGVTLDDTKLSVIAENAAKFEWNEFQIKAAIAAEAMYKPDFGGDIGFYETEIKNTAKSFMIPVSDEDAFSWAKRRAAGEVNQQGINDYYRTVAKGFFGGNQQMVQFLDSGGTLTDYFRPHTQVLAQLLELAPESIDFVNDQRFRPILNHADAKGLIRPMDIGEVTKHAKSLDDYWKTTNAQTEVSSYLTTLSQAFGKS